MNIDNIKKIIMTEMINKRSNPYCEIGSKYYHGERVAKLAIRLREFILPMDNSFDEILIVAAWARDICHGVENNHEHGMLGAIKVKEVLANECSEYELQTISDIILHHDARKPFENEYSDILKIHQDADHLDHFGTLDIWRIVSTTIGYNETILEAIKYLTDHWPDDVIRWRNSLNYDVSRAIFDDKVSFVKTFIERFTVEGNGIIWMENELLK